MDFENILDQVGHGLRNFLDELKHLAKRYAGRNIIGQIYVEQKYFGQANIRQNDFERNVVFPKIQI